MADEKTMTEREAMQRVSALAARLRETTNKKAEENPTPCIWEGRPCYWTPGEAWALIEGSWEPVNSSDVGNSARLVPAAVLAEVFPGTPPLPAEAFSARGLGAFWPVSQQEEKTMADDKKPMTEREAMQRVSALAAKLRKAAKEKTEAPFPVEMRKALAEETGMSEEDLRQLAPGLLDGDDVPAEAAQASKELQEMREEEVTAEPSLAGMLEGVDLADPRVKRFFAKIIEEAKAKKE